MWDSGIHLSSALQQGLACWLWGSRLAIFQRLHGRCVVPWWPVGAGGEMRGGSAAGRAAAAPLLRPSASSSIQPLGTPCREGGRMAFSLAPPVLLGWCLPAPGSQLAAAQPAGSPEHWLQWEKRFSRSPLVYRVLSFKRSLPWTTNDFGADGT